jgi:hypothetical protein
MFGALLYEPEIRELMAKKPSELSMADHRLKGLYVRYKKTMPKKLAWERAVEEALKVEKRARRTFPRFSPEESLRIRAYHPKHRWTRNK